MAGEAAAADPGRGRTLYEARCDGCHAQSVHGREKRAATDFDSIRGWVRRWSGNMKLAWSDEEVDDVAAWLNSRYYRFACPPSACNSTGRNREGGPALASR
jgi:mono/diheme cytochrome c family protein